VRRISGARPAVNGRQYVAVLTGEGSITGGNLQHLPEVNTPRASRRRTIPAYHHSKTVRLCTKPPRVVLLLPQPRGLTVAAIRGNTHFPMLDLNNVKLADLLSQFLRVRFKNNLHAGGARRYRFPPFFAASAAAFSRLRTALRVLMVA